MIGVVLAAGKGTRLRKCTGECNCKALKKIDDMYLIEFALNNLIDLDISRVVIVIGQQGELIKKTIGDKYKGLKVSYAYQPYQKGLINAFVQALDVIESNEDVVLQLADEIFIDLKAEDIKTYISKMFFDFYCGITYENNYEKIKNNFSIEIDENSNIKKCTEKPRVVSNNIKGTGFCIFKHSVLKLLKNIYDENSNIPNDLCDYLNYLIGEGKRGLAFCLAEKEFNINTPFDLKEAEDHLLTRK